MPAFETDNVNINVNASCFRGLKHNSFLTRFNSDLTSLRFLPSLFQYLCRLYRCASQLWHTLAGASHKGRETASSPDATDVSPVPAGNDEKADRKSTRLNSSHRCIS